MKMGDEFLEAIVYATLGLAIGLGAPTAASTRDTTPQTAENREVESAWIDDRNQRAAGIAAMHGLRTSKAGACQPPRPKHVA